MKWMNLLFTRAGTRSGIHISCGMLLLNYLVAGQQTGLNEKKKTPEDLICYQKYTLKDNFCNCSWRAGEESEDPTYTLHYCVYRDYTECQNFDAGKQTHITLTNDDVHMRENISLEVTAEEHGQNYTSKPITLILDKAVKLDPPDHNKITITREGSNITVSWTRINLFPMFFNTAKEVRYKEHPLYPDLLLCKTSTSTTCHPGRDGIPVCKEHCKFSLDGHHGYYIQIRQTYEEGIWSEWSDSIFVPAEIGPIQIEKLNTGGLNLTGWRTISLFWKPRTKEEGNMNYHINVTSLPCAGITTYHSTIQNCFHANISGAAYNVTVISSNEAQAASPWSTVIEEDWAVIPFENVTLFGNNLTVKWKGKEGKSSHCIAWKPIEMKGVSFSKLLENLNKNNATILTDNFLPMKCYRIYVHKMSKNQRTVGTTNYFKPLFSIGPRNLTVMNVTVSSVLLKWDPFDLHECQGILKNWVINRKDHATNVSNETYENSSVTQYLVEGLPHGFNYTFEVKGITVFGEQTGSSFKSVSSPWIVENTNKKLLEKTVGILAALLLVAFVFSWFKIQQCICQDLPNPSNSTATTFTPSDNKYIVSPPHLVHSCFEEKNTEPLIIKTSLKREAIETTVKETEMLDLVSTKELLHNELEMTDMDTEVEIDLQFEYRKQAAPITPINETDTSTHFFEKMKAYVPHSSESSKENDTQLSLNDVNICTGEF
ncbi:interleukin-12 receptor subunit beta-1 isoform X1 [Bufo bufo]|uniref:interleukin-12 receptor subunit beta-1 isoform X1 n=2 Tax=Bufo bufo TaxID=8384 RepID=UPI001ABE9953|nr:interleukin-12 receptor subunit beta-1 isoform X1 [Bufo bufo]